MYPWDAAVQPNMLSVVILVPNVSVQHGTNCVCKMYFILKPGTVFWPCLSYSADPQIWSSGTRWWDTLIWTLAKRREIWFYGGPSYQWQSYGVGTRAGCWHWTMPCCLLTLARPWIPSFSTSRPLLHAHVRWFLGGECDICISWSPLAELALSTNNRESGRQNMSQGIVHLTDVGCVHEVNGIDPLLSVLLKVAKFVRWSAHSQVIQRTYLSPVNKRKSCDSWKL